MHERVNPVPHELQQIFQRHLPARSARWELSVDTTRDQSVWINEEGYLFALVRVCIFDVDDGMSVRDVKEQEVCLGEYTKYSPERWLAYVTGHLRALPAIGRAFQAEVESLMPCDFFAYWEVLDDETLQSAEDFARALSDAEKLHAWNVCRVNEEWREMLEPCGLGDYVDQVRALARPALRMALEKIDDVDEDAENDLENEIVLGASRVGGEPDVPPSFQWPMTDGMPLTFVAQINFEDVAKFQEMGELPQKGLLSFFYAPFSDDPGCRSPVFVVHFADITRLEKRKKPAKGECISSYAVEFYEERVYPAIESHFFYESLLPQSQVMPFYESLRAGAAIKEPVSCTGLGYFLSCMNDVYDNERPTNRLLGHPDSIQGDPYLDVEMDSRPKRWDDWEEGTPEAYRIRQNSMRWRLLLQIDAQQEDELLLNQDGGFFYFFIPSDALAKHDWTQVRGVLQCH